MVNRLLRYQSGCACFALLMFLFFGQQANAENIHFYKVNKKGQQKEISMIRNRDEVGCHNFRRIKDVLRVSQIGFVYCSVYSEKNCPESSVHTMNWKGKVKKNSARAQPSERLQQGDLWFFGDNETRPVGSWKCE
jgi:hypothetical protein